jgi:hypothetical protein
MSPDDKYSVREKASIPERLIGNDRRKEEIRDGEGKLIYTVADKPPVIFHSGADRNAREIRNPRDEIVAEVKDKPTVIFHTLVGKDRNEKEILDSEGRTVGTIHDRPPNTFEKVFGRNPHKKDLRDAGGGTVGTIRDKPRGFFDSLGGVNRHEKEIRIRRTSGGGGTGTDGGEFLVGIILLPFSAMYAIGKGIILAAERRSFIPLVEGIAGAAGIAGIFSTGFGILWAILLWIATDIGGPQDAISRTIEWNKMFWGVAIVAWTVFALSTWVLKKRDSEEARASAPQANAGSEPAPISTAGSVVGWLVGIAFVVVAPQIVVSIAMAAFPNADPRTENPLLILPVLFLFPFGPAILIGRAVARRIG